MQVSTIRKKFKQANGGESLRRANIEAYLEALKTYETSDRHGYTGTCYYASKVMKVSPSRAGNPYYLWEACSQIKSSVAYKWDWQKNTPGRTPERVTMVRQFIKELEAAIAQDKRKR